jgi:hypothetical protein
MNDYTVEDGIVHLGFHLSEFERSLFRHFENLLRRRGFYYFSIPLR